MRAYFEMAALLFLGWGFCKGGWEVAELAGGRHSPREWLKSCRWVALASSGVPMAFLLVRTKPRLDPPIQVWSEVTRHGARLAQEPLLRITAGNGSEWLASAVAVPLSGMHGLLILIAVIAVLLLSRLVFRIRTLHARLEELPLIRRCGRVRIVASQEDMVAYSVRSYGRAWVVVPTDLISADVARLRMTLRHELQHHRQGDTLWVYAFEFFKAAFFWNPAVHGWAGFLGRLQEFACDEALIGHRKLSPRAYGSCLIEAAETAVGARALPVGTAGMAASTAGRFLRRRIEMLFTYREMKPRKWLLSAWVAGALLTMTTAAFASKGLVQDRRISMAEAQKLARLASDGAVIPITVNELVLARLNLYLGTPEGRKRVKEGLARMPFYRAMVESKIREHQMPSELLAIPLYESGFNNGAISHGPYRAAGIWQFIAETARRYDLRVDEAHDERFDPEKETVAAMRYLRDVHEEFKDWLLALKSYNEGESRVRALIERHGTRDAWELERLSSAEGYLSGAMAMMIILKNPSALED